MENYGDDFEDDYIEPDVTDEELMEALLIEEDDEFVDDEDD